MKELISYLGGQFRNIPGWKYEDSKLDKLLEMMIRRQKIVFHTGIEVGGPDYPAEKFKQDFDITVLAPGVGAYPTKLNVQGEQDVVPALDYRNAQYRASIGHVPGEEFDFSQNELYMGNKKVVLVAGGLTGEDCKETILKEQHFQKTQRSEETQGELIVLARNLEPGEKPSVNIMHPKEPDNAQNSSSRRVSELVGNKDRFQQFIRKIEKQPDGKYTVVIGHRELKESWQKKFSKEHRQWVALPEDNDYKIKDVDVVMSAAGFQAFNKKPNKLAQAFGVTKNEGKEVDLDSSHRTNVPGVYVGGDAARGEDWFLHTALGDGNRIMESVLRDVALDVHRNQKTLDMIRGSQDSARIKN